MLVAQPKPFKWWGLLTYIKVVILLMESLHHISFFFVYKICNQINWTQTHVKPSVIRILRCKMQLLLSMMKTYLKIKLEIWTSLTWLKVLMLMDSNFDLGQLKRTSSSRHIDWNECKSYIILFHWKKMSPVHDLYII